MPHVHFDAVVTERTDGRTDDDDDDDGPDVPDLIVFQLALADNFFFFLFFLHKSTQQNAIHIYTSRAVIPYISIYMYVYVCPRAVRITVIISKIIIISNIVPCWSVAAT